VQFGKPDMMGLGVLQQQPHPVAVAGQALQAVDGPDQLGDDTLYAVAVGHIDQPDVASAANFDVVEFVCVDVRNFAHHTVPVVHFDWEGALALGVFGLCRDNGTVWNFYKQKYIQFFAFATVPTLGTCSCFLKIPGLSVQNCTHCEIPNSAISAKPIRHHTAKFDIRSITASGRA
jgi:hypothetical protein